ncbi:hypothetical protein VOLCADRAFT_91420 [Volvox carteri f. nagariensis]|uniref:Uncharacterized protein n=1 Tax=Volvox carteri f. nagariensis TaxID=3068 RepID=D8TX13_VOLCA|nr:uncharacterized protein VOLCADRAFT_91420 [Volvox carteri f. nagariensis]EFJ47928.1 hypothetical protein VOLCADRAFT_91420 [Volvox carteri f. nagariensis]|eukprot:XP_002951034.1 hypothetical protein VOLCADRAFT_91420 [Volvox carteri f. nagariensis]
MGWSGPTLPPLKNVAPGHAKLCKALDLLAGVDHRTAPQELQQGCQGRAGATGGLRGGESSGSGSDSDDEDDVASSSCKTAAPPRQGEQFSPSEAVEDSQGNAAIGDSAELNEGEPMVVGAVPEAPEEEPTATGGAADSAKGKPKTTSGTTKGKPKAVEFGLRIHIPFITAAEWRRESCARQGGDQPPTTCPKSASKRRTAHGSNRISVSAPARPRPPQPHGEASAAAATPPLAPVPAHASTPLCRICPYYTTTSPSSAPSNCIRSKSQTAVAAVSAINRRAKS